MSDSTQALRFREKLGYGLGDSASNFFFQVFNIFLLYYYTDIFGIDPALIGVMFIVTKIVDAISDELYAEETIYKTKRLYSEEIVTAWNLVSFALTKYATVI